MTTPSEPKPGESPSSEQDADEAATAPGYVEQYPGSVSPGPGYAYGQPYPGYAQANQGPHQPPPAGYQQPPPGYQQPPPSFPPQGYPPQPPPYGYPQPPYGYGPPVLYPQFPHYHPPHYAGWWARAAALLIDLVLLVPFWAAALAVQWTTSSDHNLSGVRGFDTMSAFGIVLWLVAWGAGVAFNIWNRYYRAGKTGQSLGRRVLGISLVYEETGQPIGGWRAFAREWLHVLDYLPCYAGYLVAACVENKQTFADMIMKTIVVTT